VIAVTAELHEFVHEGEGQVADLIETYVVLGPDLRATSVDVTSSIWQDLDRRFGNFKGHLLVAKFDFASDWPTWEIHPAGDEIVVLLSGRAELIFDRAGSHQVMSLTEPGSFVVVPQGTWHTARISMPTSMLFVTPGEGTENKQK
jgi:mannose-6-phosphate isomerase-like protein (cupin superfamily)